MSVYSFIFDTDFLRIVHTKQLYSILSLIKLSQCWHCRANICIHYKCLLSEQILKHYQTCLVSMQIQTQKETESHGTARGESARLSLGGMSTNETSIKLWWHTSIHQHTSWSPLSLCLKWQGALEGYAGVGMIWHSVRKNTLCIPVTHCITQPGLPFLTVWLNRRTTGIPIPTFLPAGQELPNMGSFVKSSVINNKRSHSHFCFQNKRTSITNSDYMLFF